jgi:hypothetical protein
VVLLSLMILALACASPAGRGAPWGPEQAGPALLLLLVALALALALTVTLVALPLPQLLQGLRVRP